MSDIFDLFNWRTRVHIKAKKMRKVNLTPEKIKTFESALNILNDKYSNYMTLHQILNLLYPQIKSSEENIGSNNIDKIFNVFCEVFPEFVSEITIDDFSNLINSNLTENNKSIEFEPPHLTTKKTKNNSDELIYPYNSNKNYLHHPAIPKSENDFLFNGLTNEQWDRIKKVFDPLVIKKISKRANKYSYREVLNGILWIILNDRTWRELPKEFPPFSTCNRHYYDWIDNGILEKIYIILKNFYEDKVLDSLKHAIKGDLFFYKRNKKVRAKSLS